MARLTMKLELHLPFLVVGVEGLQVNSRKHKDRNLTERHSVSPFPSGLTGRFALRNDSPVAYREMIEGEVAELPPGVEAWIIVYPAQEAAYWPQSSVPLGQTRFHVRAQFGRSETKDIGEKFILLLVIASQNASTMFHGFRTEDAAMGLPDLPRETQTLARVVVTRR